LTLGALATCPDISCYEGMSDDTGARDRLTAQQYRERARLIRRQAEDAVDRPTVREQLLNLAEKYEQLADSMEPSRWGC
jgi:hypothetical protein